MSKIDFQKQPMMRKVIFSLIPVLLFSLYLYGIKVLFLALVIYPTAIGLEFLFEKGRKKKVSEAVLVTATLYLLSMPPAVPLWIAVIGIAFGVVMGKEIYGGFGRNPFNPAIVGRLFVYITFPNFMTEGWMTPGNFGTLADATTAATPLAVMRGGGEVNWLDLLIGIRPGSLGESAIILIIAAGIYLVATKTASWRLILSSIGSFLILIFCLDFLGAPKAMETVPALFSGSFLFVAVFMATDPVSAPKKPGAQWIYGIIIGCCTGIIRTYSLFSEGTSFGVLIANTFALLLDEVFPKAKKKGAKK